MPSALSGVSSTLPWGQSKKTEPSNGTGGTTQPPPSEPSTTEPTPTTTQPTASEPTPTTTTPTASEPMPTTGPSDPTAPAAKTYSASSTNAIAPMPDRLRDLIVEYSKQAAPTATALHGVVLRMPAPAEKPLAPEQVLKTRAEIIAQASVSMVAQANHTGDSVRALLGAAA